MQWRTGFGRSGTHWAKTADTGLKVQHVTSSPSPCRPRQESIDSLPGSLDRHGRRLYSRGKARYPGRDLAKRFGRDSSTRMACHRPSSLLVGGRYVKT